VTVDEPVFVKSGIEYESYTDFWRLVTLAGYRTLKAKEVDLQWDGTYIWPILDVELLGLMNPASRSRRARIIFWYLERPDAHLPDPATSDPGQILREGLGELIPWVDAVWVSDRGLHRVDPRTVYAVLGGHPDLRDAEPGPRTTDVLHLGQETPRRKAVLNELRRQGTSLTTGSLWAQKRTQALGSSRLLISIDRMEGLHVASPLRYALAAAWRLPILSEAVPDPHPLVQGESVLMAPYPQLAGAACRVLGDPELLGRVSELAYRTYCLEWTFRRGVTLALRETVFQSAGRP
jgi:hypothetical protein